MKRLALIFGLVLAAIAAADPIPINPGSGVKSASKPLVVTGSNVSCNAAGANDAGCIAASGTQTVSPAITFAADAGFAHNITIANVATAGGFCLAGGPCAQPNSPYWEITSGGLLLPSGISAIAQGQILFNAGGRLQSNTGNAGVPVYGNCDANDDTCTDFLVNSVRLRTAGWSIRTYNNGQPYAGMKVDGTVVGGGNVVPYGVGRGAFVVSSPIFGTTTITCGDSNVCVYYSDEFGNGGGDTAMGLGAHGALGGPHGGHVFADHYTHDGGWTIEWDNFTDGPQPPSKKGGIGAYGEFTFYGNNGFTHWPSLAEYDHVFGNQRASFPPCPHLEVINDGGVQFGGDAGVQQIGSIDSALIYDFTNVTGGRYFFCDEQDGGTEGQVDAGGGLTYVGWNQIVDTWDLAHGIGIVDAGFHGNVAIEGILTVASSPAATSGNGQAGGELQGYAPQVAGHGVVTVRTMTLQHPIVAASGATGGRIGMTIVTPGTSGGTYDLLLVDTTASATICTKTGVSCTLSAGDNSAGCSGGISAAAAGHAIALRIDTTNCTGSTPGGTVFADW